MSAGVRTRARRQPAEVRREEILDAAVRVFARSAYRSAGTAEIAREAGVAEPTLYRHFSNKRELFLEAVERADADIHATFLRIASETEDAQAALEQMGQWYEQSIAQHAEILRMRQRATAEAEDEEVQARCRKSVAAIQAVIAGVIRRGQAQGVFSTEVDAEAAAWLYMGIGKVIDFAVLTGMDRLGFPACVEGIGQVFARALAPRPA